MATAKTAGDNAETVQVPASVLQDLMAQVAALTAQVAVSQPKAAVAFDFAEAKAAAQAQGFTVSDVPAAFPGAVPAIRVDY